MCVKARACERIGSAFTWLMAFPVQAGRELNALSQNASHGQIKGFPDPSDIPQASKTYTQTLCTVPQNLLANIHVCTDCIGHYKVKGPSSKLSVAITGG